MALITLKELFDGYDEGFAVGAFNVHNMEYTQGVMAAAVAEDSPVILMIGAGMLKYFGMGWITALCRHAAENVDVPVVIHLDHSRGVKTIVEGIRAGVSSVMFDGSHYPFDENVALTKQVVEMAHMAGVSVEGELGAIGGVEDDIETLAGKLTDPDDAKRFAEETGVDALAVAIGNCHGLYKEKPNLDMTRLQAIKEKVSCPIVMHGGSDIPEDQVRRSVEIGIRKFNVGTDLKVAFSETLRKTLMEEAGAVEPPKVLGPARQAVEDLAREKMRLLGSSGKGRSWKKTSYKGAGF